MSASERPGDDSGREQGADESLRPDGNVADDEPTVPLFLRDWNDGRKGNAQDEKDEVGE